MRITRHMWEDERSIKTIKLFEKLANYRRALTVFSNTSTGLQKFGKNYSRLPESHGTYAGAKCLEGCTRYAYISCTRCATMIRPLWRLDLSYDPPGFFSSHWLSYGEILVKFTLLGSSWKKCLPDQLYIYIREAYQDFFPFDNPAMDEILRYRLKYRSDRQIGFFACNEETCSAFPADGLTVVDILATTI